MSTWSRPYVKVVDASGATRDWTLPRPQPSAPGQDADAGAQVSLTELGLDGVTKVSVRWRAPGSTNPRKATFGPSRLREALALVCAVQCAADARGVGWAADSAGRPVALPEQPRTLTESVPVPPPPAPAPAAHPATLSPAVESRPLPTSGAPGAGLALPAAADSGALLRVNTVLDPGSRVRVGADNLMVKAVADSYLALGATVRDVIASIIRERWDSWTPTHRTNMANTYAFVEHVMVYREPWEDDSPEVAEWKRARLNLPGVEEGASLHVSLILSPDLTDAIMLRRTTDRRVALLNTQARARHEAQWARYLGAQAAKSAGSWRGGRLPMRPPDELTLRPQPEKVSARTEELFATAVGCILRAAEGAGLLIGPNPWKAFAPSGRPNVGYRRPRPLQVHERNVTPMGVVDDLADDISRRGPLDPRTGKPTGERFRALVLASCAAGRPSEYTGMRPGDYIPGEEPSLLFAQPASLVAPAANEGSGLYVADSLKDRDPGEVRRVGLPRYVADALDAHVEAGYASDDHLFTGPRGGVLRWGNLVETYWRPAVERVCGHSSERILRELEWRWLRKGAITWMLRSGMPITDVAELAGHSPAVMFDHYAGVVASSRGAHQWTSWDDAWAWAVTETDLA